MNKTIIVTAVTLGVLGWMGIRNIANAKSKHCGDPYNIKTLPFKDEPIHDITYSAFMSNKKLSIPCLIGSITDTRKMQDPRQAPPYEGFVVGDAAFFVLLHITKKPLKSFLPQNIQDKFDKEGIYTYFGYVSKDSNRKKLQNTLRQVFSQSSSPDM